MNSRLQRIHRSLALTALVASFVSSPVSAATLVAGWDFSQYFGANALTTDGATLATTLPANYSDFDPTYGAGAESAAFGTMFNDGTNGSTMTNGAFMPYLPTAGSLTLNLDAPQNNVPVGDVQFSSFNVLDDEFPGRGLPHQDLAMISNAAHMVVFQADLSTAPAQNETKWFLSLAGRTEISGSADVQVDFAAGAGGFTTVDTVTIGASETLFEVPLGDTAETSVLVRLVFPAPGGQGQRPIIDNVAIRLPEPGTVGQVVALLAILAMAHYRSGRRLLRV